MLHHAAQEQNNTAINGEPGLDMHNGILDVLEVEGFESGNYQEDLNEARKVARVTWVPGGGSELTGPAFTRNGQYRYFSSQRGNALGSGIPGLGITYELKVPEKFR